MATKEGQDEIAYISQKTSPEIFSCVLIQI